MIELEGPDTQLALLKSLPDNGLPLLEDTLIHWQTNARLLQTMVSWWLEAPPDSAGKLALPSTFSNSLNDLLMHQRNRQWCQFLRQLPPGAMWLLSVRCTCTAKEIYRNCWRRNKKRPISLSARQ